jgi:Aminoglycoside-2''-adenylyltransferase
VTSIPRPVVRVAELMATFRPWWALCGGWAVDAWIGGQTRDHVDIDIASFADDQRAVFEQVPSWNLIRTTRSSIRRRQNFWNGWRLVLPAHVHAHPHGDVDFETLGDRLDRDERTWLRDSISRVYPSHAWLDRLSDQDQD